MTIQVGQKGRITGRVMITGGTGSLGHAILARAKREGWDALFTIYSRDEVKQGDMKAIYPDHRYVLGDVRDLEGLKLRMAGHDLVIHAAAYKQVPSAQVNPWEAIATNVVGSQNIAMAAVRVGIPRVLGISTDKACAPVNTYGQTKALMETLFQDATRWGATQFNLVRYGNVLGSRGSVVPLFRRQAKEQGVVTITDPNMTRFWLTLEDAVDIILKGLDETEGGTIIIPRAPASTMEELAKAVAPEAAVAMIGSRPGEKAHEELIHAGEMPHAQEVGQRYFRLYPSYSPPKLEICGMLGGRYSSEYARRLSIEELREMLEVEA